MVKSKRTRRSTKFNNKKKSYKSSNIYWNNASDVKKKLSLLLDKLSFDKKYAKRIYCVRSYNANTRAIARIYGLSRIWQQILDQSPAYILEVISEKYDNLSDTQKDKVILHEFAHIPKNFSGSLIPHIRKGKRSFYLKLKRLIENVDKV